MARRCIAYTWRVLLAGFFSSLSLSLFVLSLLLSFFTFSSFIFSFSHALPFSPVLSTFVSFLLLVFPLPATFETTAPPPPNLFSHFSSYFSSSPSVDCQLSQQNSTYWFFLKEIFKKEITQYNRCRIGIQDSIYFPSFCSRFMIAI